MRLPGRGEKFRQILCPNCHAVETLYTGLAEQPDAALLESAALVA